MTREIKNVFVNGISLVSKDKLPAVEQAENRFALFKIKKTEDSEKNQKTFEEIKKNLSKFKK